MQIIKLLQLHNIKTPANIISFLDKFDFITSLELIEYDTLLRSWFYVPEVDPFSFSFYSAGYETSFYCLNAVGFQATFLLLFGSHVLLIGTSSFFTRCS